jgi:pSer/pThr/pTyr-binding forkhead associated (FHA) protein
MAGPDVYLKVVSGEDKGKAWELTPSQIYVIGRSRKCNLLLSDPTISAAHARLTCEKGVWFVTDLSSSHGTQVNGNRILAAKPIFDRDTIRLGKSVLQFREYEQLSPEDLAEAERGMKIVP